MSLGRWSRLVPAASAVVSLIAGLATFAAPAAAQRGIEVTPQVGWLWGGTLDFTGGSVHINAAPEYGGTIGVELQPGYFGELSYHYQGSELIGRPNGAGSVKLFDIATHYIHFSGRRVMPTQGRAAPFVLGGVGMTIFAPGNTNYPGLAVQDQYLLSFSVGGGFDIAMNDKVSLRLQARGLVPVSWVEGGVYFGSGGGGVSISGGSAMLQGDASLGLTFHMGE